MERQSNETDESVRGSVQETQTSKVIRKERRRSSIEQFVSLFKVKKVSHNVEDSKAGTSRSPIEVSVTDNTEAYNLTPQDTASVKESDQKTSNANDNKHVSKPESDGVNSRNTQAPQTAALNKKTDQRTAKENKVVNKTENKNVGSQKTPIPQEATSSSGTQKPSASKQQTDQNIPGTNANKAADQAVNKNVSGNRINNGILGKKAKEPQNDKPGKSWGLSDYSLSQAIVANIKGININKLEIGVVYAPGMQIFYGNGGRPFPSRSHCSEEDYRDEAPYRGSSRRHTYHSVLAMDEGKLRELAAVTSRDCKELGLTDEDRRKFYKKFYADPGFNRWFKLALGAEVVMEWIRPLITHLVEKEYKEFKEEVNEEEFSVDEINKLKDIHVKLIKLRDESQFLPSYEALLREFECGSEFEAKLNAIFVFVDKHLIKKVDRVKALPLLHNENILRKNAANDNENEDIKNQWILACIYMTTGWVMTYDGPSANSYDVTNLVAYLKNIKGGLSHFCFGQASQIAGLTSVRNGLLHNKSQSVSQEFYESKFGELVKLVNSVYEKREDSKAHILLTGGKETDYSKIKGVLRGLKNVNEVSIDFEPIEGGKCEYTYQAIKEGDDFKKMDERRKLRLECDKLDNNDGGEAANLLGKFEDLKKNYEKIENNFILAQVYLGKQKSSLEDKTNKRDGRKKEKANLIKRGKENDPDYFKDKTVFEGVKKALANTVTRKIVLYEGVGAMFELLKNQVNPQPQQVVVAANAQDQQQVEVANAEDQQQVEVANPGQA